MPKAAERQPPLLYCIRHKNSFASQSEDQPAPCVLRGINKTGVLSMTCRYSSTMPSKGMAELPHTGLSPTWCFAIPLLRVHTSKDFDAWLMRKKVASKTYRTVHGPLSAKFIAHRNRSVCSKFVVPLSRTFRGKLWSILPQDLQTNSN